jgi:glyoxylase-like metal-dependent hydrolase (beta-lactamase superfamily II)
MSILFRGFTLAALMALAYPAMSAPAASTRLYALDCGRARFADMGMFADTGEYDGKPGSIVDPCFVIVHPHGTLLWDTGLGDDLVGKDRIEGNGAITLHVDTSLVAQLQTLKLTPDDITFVGFSHLHFDHTGNANRFMHSTWLINRTELQAALSDSPPFGVDPKLISNHQSVQLQQIDGDFDVFGDGTVRILKAPGHTPGHQVLLVKLAHAGPVLLSGDLYHTRENRSQRRVPGINTDRADTLASFDRIEHIVANQHARVIVQHDPRDIASLPHFPAFLD